ncbi:MAG TPA: glycosyl hydrolase family 65 protein [Ktedonobacterales bacterium]
MMIFDWDGTAVANRLEDASALARLAEPLLADGCWLIVVTGTSFDHIARQFCDLVAPDCRQRLVVCANRGSEVFGFDKRGQTMLRFRRTATAAEDQALSAIAEAVRDELVQTTHLDIGIVYDRLNRRKIDLIPLPEWVDPPKAEIGALREAVEARLAMAGWRGGIAAVVDLAERLAARAGIAVRITSDVKHVEIGLTDKADAIAWIRRELMAPEGIGEEAVLVVGDEFGQIGGFPGSDDRLRVGLEAAPAVSVGIEPSGVPAGVEHLGGGPHAFRALLARQIARRCSPSAGEATAQALVAGRRIASRVAPRSAARSAAREHAGWTLTVRGVRPELEHMVESLLAVGNGFMGVRGSLEDPHPASRPATLIAGLFGEAPEPQALHSLAPARALAPAPDWLRMRLFVDGEPIALGASGAAEQLTRTLDLRDGLLQSEWSPVSSGLASTPAVTIQTLRLVSQVRRGLGVQVIRIEAASAATVMLQTWLEPPSLGLVPCDARAPGTAWRTADGAHALGCRAQTALSTDGHVRRPLRQRAADDKHTWAWDIRPGHPATFVRIVSLARDDRPEDADRQTAAQLEAARAVGIETLIAEHVRAWHALWDTSDIRITGDDEAQRQVRFAIYHLLSAANPDDEHVSIGARGLTGEGYLGHVFWDTDIFLVPFYTAAWPAAARALLMYRYHTLPAARARAAELGYHGALYAWESADTGADVTPAEVVGPDGQRAAVRCGTQEQHISADVAYAVWRYWSFTHDHDFLLAAGAEILLETARFWASRCTLEGDGRYHIRHVIGPDEYHEDVDDNAYTNGMARWNLDCARTTARLIATRWPRRWQALAQHLAIGEKELARWRDISARLAGGAPRGDPSRVMNASAQPHVIEQFAGYFGLEPIDLRAYATRTLPVDIVLGQERVQQSQIIKQADVIMLLALLPKQFSRRSAEANYAFYEPRCGHGSSLSPAIHALVAARLGKLEIAERYFHQSAEIDLDEDAGTAAQGVHMAALGGLWSAVVFGFAGLWSQQAALRLEPRLPVGWTALELPLQWRGRRLRYRIQASPPRLTLQLAAGSPPMSVLVSSVHVRQRHRRHRRLRAPVHAVMYTEDQVGWG